MIIIFVPQLFWVWGYLRTCIADCLIVYTPCVSGSYTSCEKRYFVCVGRDLTVWLLILGVDGLDWCFMVYVYASFSFHVPIFLVTAG